jgi:hypothetical protein
MDSSEALTKRVQTLAPIVAGLNQALAKLDLNEAERTVLKTVATRYTAEYEAARKKLKAIRKQAQPPTPKKQRAKRGKPKPVDEVQLIYKKERERKITETHKISGFNRRWISVVQGGAPGSGKNS